MSTAAVSSPTLSPAAVAAATADAPIVPLLVGERFVEPSVERFTPVYNPATGEVIARTPAGGPAEVDAAVQAALRAFATWSVTPPPKRAAVLFRYRELLEREFEALARLVSRENGKTLDEARGDVRRGVEVVEFACGIGHLIKGENLPRVAEHLDGLTMREPVGVCAGITPFNFPAMVPMWMFPLAIACGNTFVLKPSEKVPLTGNRLGELLLEAGLPPGVFNVVHGGREVVDALCTHPQIAALSFVGSTAVARHVYTLGGSHGKRVQAAGGAKNVLLVLPDAEPDPTLRAIMGSAYGCAGQRCMAGSLLMSVGDREFAHQLRDQVVGAIDALQVDDPLANPRTGMGPVIDRAAQERVGRTVAGVAAQGQAKVVRDGRQGALPAGGGFFLRPSLLDEVRPEPGGVFDQEIFGPVLSMLRPQTLDEAIGWMKRLGYGNGASVFTQSGYAARKFAHEMPCGMIGINVGVPAPMAQFPFAGWNQSFFGDLHVQGTEGIMFYTRQRVVLTRWDRNYQRQQGW